MGCGTSKSVQVVGKEITTKPVEDPAQSPQREPESSDDAAAVSNADARPSIPSPPQTTKPASPAKKMSKKSKKSETSVKPAEQPASPAEKTASPAEKTASPAEKPAASPAEKPASPAEDTQSKVMDDVLPSTTGEPSAVETTEVGDRSYPGVAENSSNDRYASFEIDMSNKGTTSPTALPPRRLEKLPEVPKVTAEMLAEKQKVVQERKEKELEKRANPRLSKIERLRKEILEARDAEGDAADSVTGQSKDGSSRTTSTKADFGGDGYIEGASEMEVDKHYNVDTEPGELWGGEIERPKAPSNVNEENQELDMDDFGEWG